MFAAETIQGRKLYEEIRYVMYGLKMFFFDLLNMNKENYQVMKSEMSRQGQKDLHDNMSVSGLMLRRLKIFNLA